MASVSGQILPLRPVPQRFVTQLAGVTYNLRTRWSVGSDCWMLDISDQDNTPILGSIPLVTGADLLEQYGYLNFGGALYAFSTVGPPDVVPTLGDLGVTAFAIFVPA